MCDCEGREPKINEESYMNPNPTCKKDCRFHSSAYISDAVYYSPVFDKHGNNLNPDRNVTTYQINCSVCNKKWEASSQYGETTYVEFT